MIFLEVRLACLSIEQRIELVCPAAVDESDCDSSSQYAVFAMPNTPLPLALQLVPKGNFLP